MPRAVLYPSGWWGTAQAFLSVHCEGIPAPLGLLFCSLISNWTEVMENLTGSKAEGSPGQGLDDRDWNGPAVCLGASLTVFRKLRSSSTIFSRPQGAAPGNHCSHHSFRLGSAKSERQHEASICIHGELGENQSESQETLFLQAGFVHHEIPAPSPSSLFWHRVMMRKGSWQTTLSRCGHRGRAARLAAELLHLPAAPGKSQGSECSCSHPGEELQHTLQSYTG